MAGLSGARAQRLLGNLTLALQLLPESHDDYFLAVAGGAASCAGGRHPKPTAWLAGAEDELARIVRGEIDVTNALSRGTVEVRGNYYHAIDLSRLALAARTGSKPQRGQG